MTTTTTTYHLRAVTDDLAARTHLGATEKANVTFCGVKLIAKGDTRFGGKYADKPFTATTELATIDCGACQRSAAWKNRKGSTYAPAAPQPKATTAAGKAER